MTFAESQFKVFASMKRFNVFFACIGLCAGLLAPQKAAAFSWEWIAPFLRSEPLQMQSDKKPTEFVCKKRNSWGKCILLGPNTQKKQSTFKWK